MVWCHTDSSVQWGCDGLVHASHSGFSRNVFTLLNMILPLGKTENKVNIEKQ